jgi:hypothetical protein
VTTYRFVLTVKVNGRLHQAGDLVPAADIPPGNLESLLRTGGVVEHDPADPGEAFAAVMAAGGLPRGKLVTLLPAGFTLAAGPTEDDMRAAVAEIERLRALAGEQAAAICTAGTDCQVLRDRVAELEAAAQQRLTDDGNPHPAPADKPAEKGDEKPPAPPAEGKAKPPTIGPAKPPDLKAGRK